MALVILNEAIELDPHDPKACQARAEALMNLGRSLEARADIDTAIIIALTFGAYKRIGLLS